MTPKHGDTPPAENGEAQSRRTFRLETRWSLVGNDSIVARNLGDRPLVVRFTGRSCNVDVPSGIAVVEAQSAVTVNLLDLGSTGIWSVLGEVLNETDARKGKHSTTGLTADLRGWLLKLDTTSGEPTDLPAPTEGPVTTYALQKAQQLYEKAKKYLTRWGLYWLRSTLIDEARLHELPPPDFLQLDTFAGHFEHYAGDVWSEPLSESSRRFSRAVSHFLGRCDPTHGERALDGALRGIAISYAGAACRSEPDCDNESVAARLRELGDVARSHRYERKAAQLAALEFALLPTESRWRELETIVRYAWDNLDPRERSTPLRVLRSLRSVPRYENNVAIACLQAAIEERARRQNGNAQPSLRWFALGTLLYDAKRWGAAATAFDYASATATDEHPIEVSGLARGALARAQALQATRKTDASEELLAVREQILSSFPDRAEAQSWATKLEELALVLQLDSLDHAMDLEVAEKTCHELARITVAQSGRPSALVEQVRGRIRFYRHLRKGEYAEAEAAAAALTRIATKTARARITSSVALGLCAAAIGRYVASQYDDFLMLASDARTRFPRQRASWDRVQRLTTCCHVVALMERAVVRREKLAADDEDFLRDALVALDEDAALTDDAKDAWIFLLGQIGLVQRCHGRLSSLVGDDLIQHLRSTARICLSLTGGGADVGSKRIQVVDAMRARQDWLTLPPALGSQFEELEALAGSYSGSLAVARRVSILEGVLRLVLRGICRRGVLNVSDEHVEKAPLGELIRLAAGHTWPTHASRAGSFVSSAVARKVVEFRNDQAHARFDELDQAELTTIDRTVQEGLRALLVEAPVVANVTAHVPAGTLVSLQWALVPRVVCIGGLDITERVAKEPWLLNRERLLQVLQSGSASLVPKSVVIITEKSE